MKAIQLYNQLEKDFITSSLSDEWAQDMNEVKEYLCDNFIKRSMGLVCDFADEITKIYSAVFPTDEIMNKIISDDTYNAMLFVHHPSIWDIRKAPNVFYQMSKKSLEQFKERKISIYNLHVPLDNFSDYSTSKTLAEALDIKIEKPFGKYFGALCGVIGTTDCKTMKELQNKFSNSVGHNTKLYQYGSNEILEGKIAVVAGGGNDLDIVSEMTENNIKVLVTGITAKTAYSQATHEYEEKYNINVLGGTHYSTEKFACQAMCKYFKKLELPSEFIEGEPVLEDM